MSAWPEAVYIIREIQNSLNLTQRVLKLENRLYVFAPQKENETGILEPDLEEEYNFSNDSVWFVERQNNNNQIFAASVYSETQGWSSFIYLSPESGEVHFVPSEEAGVLTAIDNVQDALNTLGEAITNIQVNDATKEVKGIVQIGNNITVENGVISIPTANSVNAGVVKMYSGLGTNIDGTMTQAAIKAAIGQNPLSSENLFVTNWSTSVSSLSGSPVGYYSTSGTMTTSYGDHPTVSLVATSPYDVPTPEQAEAFNRIDFITVNGNEINFYASLRPQTDFTVNIKM